MPLDLEKEIMSHNTSPPLLFRAVNKKKYI
jgi:hypothetical protein